MLGTQFYLEVGLRISMSCFGFRFLFVPNCEYDILLGRVRNIRGNIRLSPLAKENLRFSRLAVSTLATPRIHSYAGKKTKEPFQLRLAVILFELTIYL